VNDACGGFWVLDGKGTLPPAGDLSLLPKVLVLDSPEKLKEDCRNVLSSNWEGALPAVDGLLV
jgi:hypothetical protein